jgi:hypothetical protein
VTAYPLVSACRSFSRLREYAISIKPALPESTLLDRMPEPEADACDKSIYLGLESPQKDVCGSSGGFSECLVAGGKPLFPRDVFRDV